MTPKASVYGPLRLVCLLSLPTLWMVVTSISHHFETWETICLLVFTAESSFQGGGAGFRPSTVSQVVKGLGQNWAAKVQPTNQPPGQLPSAMKKLPGPRSDWTKNQFMGDLSQRNASDMAGFMAVPLKGVPNFGACAPHRS